MITDTQLAEIACDPSIEEWFGRLSKKEQELLMKFIDKSQKAVITDNHFTTRSESPRYNKLSFCGSGGMGSVYVLHDENLAMKRAIKIAHGQDSEESNKEYLRRLLFFEKEVRLLARLDHPGIPQIMDVGHDQAGNPSYVMNLIKGDSLDVYIQKNKDESVTKRLHLFFKICEIVHYAHGNNFAHLDLKPDNIIISDYGQVYVIDWGLSLEIDSELEALTIEGIAPCKSSVMGTPEWIAPEQLFGMPASRSMDVFALGLIGLFILTGELPRDIGESTGAIHTLSVRPLTPQTMSSLKSLPAGLRKIFTHALKVDPSQRIDSASSLVHELQHWIDYGVTKRDRSGVFGYLRYQRIAHPIRYFTILYTCVFMIAITAAFISYEAWEGRHLNNELNEIIEATDMTDKESREYAIQKLRVLRDHHGESSAMNRLMDLLSK